MSQTPSKPTEFGTRVRKAREALGLLRPAFAAQAQISASALKNLESGRQVAEQFIADKIVATIAKHDPASARWVAAASDAPSCLGDPDLTAGPACSAVARIKASRIGPRICLSVDVDASAVAQVADQLRQGLGDASVSESAVVWVTVAVNKPSL